MHTVTRALDRRKVRPMSESDTHTCMAHSLRSVYQKPPHSLCADEAFRRLGDMWLCPRHFDRALHAARLILEEEVEHMHGAREYEANAAAVVYYLRRSSDGLIKIGMTETFWRRLSQLRCEHGDMQILLTHRGGWRDEADAHWQFRRLWVEGEFFRLRKPLMKWIIKVRQMQPADTLLRGTLSMPDLLTLAAREIPHWEGAK